MSRDRSAPIPVHCGNRCAHLSSDPPRLSEAKVVIVVVVVRACPPQRLILRAAAQLCALYIHALRRGFRAVIAFALVAVALPASRALTVSLIHWGKGTSRRLMSLSICPDSGARARMPACKDSGKSQKAIHTVYQG
jgi:hypothetical protein